MLKLNRLFRKDNKKVKLYRSTGGNIIILIFLITMSLFMILPMFYAVVQSFKPIDELFAYPPKFFVRNPTINNYLQAIKLADNLYVPFSRYLVNSIFVSIVGTSAYVILSAAAGYALGKGKFPGNALISSLE